MMIAKQQIVESLKEYLDKDYLAGIHMKFRAEITKLKKFPD